MKTVTVYTDGACSGNPGPGGCSRAKRGILPCREGAGAAGERGSKQILTAAGRRTAY